MEQERPKRERLINKSNTELLSPQNIDDKPIPTNIKTIIDDLLHLSLNQPKGIAPNPINNAPKDHNLINSSYYNLHSISMDKIITK